MKWTCLEIHSVELTYSIHIPCVLGDVGAVHAQVKSMARFCRVVDLMRTCIGIRCRITCALPDKLLNDAICILITYKRSCRRCTMAQCERRWGERFNKTKANIKKWANRRAWATGRALNSILLFDFKNKYQIDYIVFVQAKCDINILSALDAKYVNMCRYFWHFVLETGIGIFAYSHDAFSFSFFIFTLAHKHTRLTSQPFIDLFILYEIYVSLWLV